MEKEDLSVKLLGLYDDRLDVTTEIKSIEKEIAGIEYSISTISDYLKLKPIHKQYKAARDPDKFYREHESELRLFDSRKKAVNAAIYTVLRELLYLFEYKLSTSEEEANKKRKISALFFFAIGELFKLLACF